MEQHPALSMAAEYVEVCFPAWPARRSVAMPGIGAGPLEAAAVVAAALAVPGAIAALSVVMMSLMIAFVLLAPAALALLAWAAWRHDRSTPLTHAPTRSA